MSKLYRNDFYLNAALVKDVHLLQSKDIHHIQNVKMVKIGGGFCCEFTIEQQYKRANNIIDIGMGMNVGGIFKVIKLRKIFFNQIFKPNSIENLLDNQFNKFDFLFEQNTNDDKCYKYLFKNIKLKSISNKITITEKYVKIYKPSFSCDEIISLT